MIDHHHLYKIAHGHGSFDTLVNHGHGSSVMVILIMVMGVLTMAMEVLTMVDYGHGCSDQGQPWSWKF